MTEHCKTCRDLMIERDELLERVAALETILVYHKPLPASWGLSPSEERIVRHLLARDTATHESVMTVLYDARGLERPSDKTINVMVCRIRKKLGRLGYGLSGLQNHWGHGWFFAKDVKKHLKHLAETYQPG